MTDSFSPSLHVLVIDDDDRLRGLLQEYLYENRILATAAEDPKVAAELMQYFQFDLLIVDIMMPYQNGLEFVESLRQHSKVPVILLTARGDIEDRIHGLEIGADDYLPKPFDPRELLLRIQRISQRTQSSTTTQTKLHFGEYR